MKSCDEMVNSLLCRREKFFTEILITLTADGVEKYSKNILNSYYLQDWVVDKIKEQLPIEVINK